MSGDGSGWAENEWPYLVQGPAQVRCQGTDGGDGLLLDLERLFPRSHLALCINIVGHARVIT